MKKHLVLLPLLLSLTLNAQVLNTLDYFAGEPGLCMAFDPTNTGTFQQQVIDTVSCPGSIMVDHTLGEILWGQENFVIDDGFIKIVDNTELKNGIISRGRCFYRQGHLLGSNWILSVITNKVTWSFGSYNDPWYNGQAACEPDPNPPHTDWPGAPFSMWADTGVFPNFLFDYRSGPTNSPVDVNYIKMNGKMGNTIEVYYYGRWRDPVDGEFHGLGIIGFEVDHYSNGDGTGDIIVERLDLYHYIVQCKNTPACFRCPEKGGINDIMPHSIQKRITSIPN